MSPSWKVHRTVGDIVCNFHNHEIDKLIDSTERHDAGRYDKVILSEQIDYVWNKWKWEGVCYYVLHHILDRLADIIVSELCKLCEECLRGRITIEQAYEELLENTLQRAKKDYYIQGLWKTGDEKKDKLLKYTIDYILVSLEAGWEMCIGFIVMDVSAKGKPTTGTRVFHGMLVKSIARQIFRGTSGFSQQQIIDFLIKLGDVAQKKMKEFEKIKEDRKAKLTKEYERLFPLLKKSIDEF